jgi:hypothetical protein
LLFYSIKRKKCSNYLDCVKFCKVHITRHYQLKHNLNALNQIKLITNQCAFRHETGIRSDQCGEQEANISGVCRLKHETKMATRTFKRFCCNLLILERCILDSVDKDCVTKLQNNYKEDPLKKAQCEEHLIACNQENNLNLPYIQNLVGSEIGEVRPEVNAKQEDRNQQSTAQLLSRKPVFESSTATQHNSAPEVHPESQSPTIQDQYRVTSGSEDQPQQERMQPAASTNSHASFTYGSSGPFVMLLSFGLFAITRHLITMRV